ncbi:MAG: MlaD family protein [Gemmatimonadales bacterium]|nr:MlaD family protein [Gemmatimonadales bacterium]
MRFESADFKVGLLVLASLAAVVTGVLWLRPKTEEGPRLYVVYDELLGLTDNSPVTLSGFEVGRVEAVEPLFKPGRGLQFRIRLRVIPRFARGDTLLLPRGTRAVLTPPALPVRGFVQGEITLVPPPDSLATADRLLMSGDQLPGEVASTMLADMQKFTQKATPELEATLEKARALMDALVETSTQTARLARASSTLLDSSATQVPRIMAQVERSLGTTDSILHDVKATTPGMKPLLDSVQVLMNESKDMARRANGMMEGWQPSLDRIIRNADTMSVYLNAFTKEVTRKPWKVLTGVKPRKEE